jgi:hypothetical protein
MDAAPHRRRTWVARRAGRWPGSSASSLPPVALVARGGRGPGRSRSPALVSARLPSVCRAGPRGATCSPHKRSDRALRDGPVLRLPRRTLRWSRIAHRERGWPEIRLWTVAAGSRSGVGVAIKAMRGVWWSTLGFGRFVGVKRPDISSRTLKGACGPATGRRVRPCRRVLVCMGGGVPPFFTSSASESGGVRPALAARTGRKTD